MCGLRRGELGAFVARAVTPPMITRHISLLGDAHTAEAYFLGSGGSTAEMKPLAGRSFLGPCSLTYRWLSSPSVCTQPSSVKPCVQIATSYKETDSIGLGSNRMTSFNLITTLKTLSPNTVTF